MKVLAARRLRSFLLFAAVLGSARPARGQAALTPFDVARIRSVSSVAISPDGSRVAYTLSAPRRPLEEEDGPAWVELHVVGGDGAPRGFVTGQVTVEGVAWKPDGREISFVAKRGKDERRSLYTIAADGGEARRLLASGSDVGAYSWSPDGKRIAFLSPDETAKTRRDLEKKGFDQQVYEESARPARLWIADVSAAEAKPRLVDLPGSFSEVRWSPSGSRLAVVVAPTSLVDDSYMSRRVAIVDADAGRWVAKFENPGKLGTILAWSPDGKELAFLSAADVNDPSAGRLVVVPAAGGPLRDLIPRYAANVTGVAWQDPDTLLYLADEGVSTTVRRIRRDGSGGAIVVPPGGAVLTSLDHAAAGRAAAMVGQTPEHPPEVFFSAFDAPSPRRLTTSNPWLSSITLARQEVVRFKARDGLELEGLLIRPRGDGAGSRAPLIVSVHGGPESHHRNGWLTGYAEPGQVAAARGFAVFYPNYRGSTGRGVAFSKLGQNDPAGKEFDDVVDAVDHLVRTGVADRARVGITGGSYGGYATAWCSTYYSERFAAGVMFVGISDLVSKAGTTDIPNEEYLVHARIRPWQDWDRMLKRSPIFHVQKSRTPLLILDGKEDPRVHPSQSLMLYRYLKALDQAPVRLVLYPGEGHGNRFAAHRLDYNLRMIQWFEHYLKGPGGKMPDYEIEYSAPTEPR